MPRRLIDHHLFARLLLGKIISLGVYEWLDWTEVGLELSLLMFLVARLCHSTTHFITFQNLSLVWKTGKPLIFGRSFVLDSLKTSLRFILRGIDKFEFKI